MAVRSGLQCPWCGYTPRKGFKVLKTMKFRKHTERGHKCPKCGQSFISRQEALQQKFLAKEHPQVIKDE